jgi:DNA-binding FadR family transcriptional regulator
MECPLDQTSPAEPDKTGAASALRLEERIYHDLLARIHTGTYALGARLPTEHELAAEFGVSRPVIRAALARLREAGLVVSRRGAGSFVSAGETGPSTGFGALGSIDDIAGFFAFRRFIEGESAATAARNHTPEDLETLHRMLASIDRDIEAGQVTIDIDIRFHAAIAKAGGNRFLQETLAMLRPHMLFVGQFVRSLSPSGYVDSKRKMQAEHRRLLETIASGAPGTARAAMEEHIMASERRIFKGTGNAD